MELCLWHSIGGVDNWFLSVLTQSKRLEFNYRMVHDNLSFFVGYMRFPVPEHKHHNI